ncbi:MAG: DUF72 domain-containing protein [Candidatus Rokuibacteriota bacterium]
MTASPERGRGDIRVGICSWADAALIEDGSFYPRKAMTAEARLRHYASVFDVVEVNSSYYAIPDVRTTAQWVVRTPPAFLFHLKAFAPMTGHRVRPEALPASMRALLPGALPLTERGDLEVSARPPEALDAAFSVFRAAVEPIARAGKLGYVLFQLAPWVHYGSDQLDYLTSLPGRLPGWTVAVEFRHRSWYGDHTEQTLAVLRAAGLAHVIVDAPVVPNAVPRVLEATASTAIVRLHGRHGEGWLAQLRGEEPAVREKYDYLYTESELASLVPEVDALAEGAERVFISFNNNNRAYPVQNALMMKRLLGQPTPTARPEQRDLLLPEGAP